MLGVKIPQNLCFPLETNKITRGTGGEGRGGGNFTLSLPLGIMVELKRLLLPQRLLLLVHDGGGGEMLLPLAALGGGDPRALDVGWAFEPSTLAASPAPHVGTVFLGLVPTILAIYTSSSSSGPHHHRQ